MLAGCDRNNALLGTPSTGTQVAPNLATGKEFCSVAVDGMVSDATLLLEHLGYLGELTCLQALRSRQHHMNRPIL